MDEETAILPAVKTPRGQMSYTDLSGGAAINGLRATVLLESRVLHEFSELDPALGHNTAGVVLAVLVWHLAAGDQVGDDRLTVCLTRRGDNCPVEVDLMLLRRNQQSGERFYLRIADVRPIDFPTNE